MYITEIEVTNFGRVRHALIQVQEGQVIVRGGNEKGKSTTMIQAPLYAFFGATTLEDSLEDVVTLGEAVTSMKVRVVYGPYEVKRSKSSASVTGNDIKISGQKEVSEFFCDLFGIAKGTETHVLVSEQGETAGILKKKPAEVTRFIESIAGFDQIDELMERVKEKFPSGFDKIYEEKLIELGTEAEELNLVELPDIKKTEDQIKVLEEKNIEVSSSLEKLKEELLVTQNSLKVIRDNNNEIQKADIKLTNLADTATSKDKEVEKLDRLVYDHVPADRLQKAEYFIQGYDDFKKEWQAYKWVSSIVMPDDIWEGDENNFLAELDSAKTTVEITKGWEAEIKSEIRVLNKGILTDKTCDKCGQDLQDFEKINLKINKEVEKLSEKLIRTCDRIEEGEDYLVDLERVKKAHEKFKREADLDHLMVDTSQVPHLYSWEGPIPKEPNAEKLKEANDLVKQDFSIREKIKADNKRIIELELEIKRIKEAYVAADKEKATLGMQVDTSPTEAEEEEVKGDIGAMEKTLKFNSEFLSIDKVTLATDTQTIKVWSEKLAVNKESTKEYTNKLKQDDRNKKILKAVRSAKPKVLNTVWDKILISVSQTFSEMRGQQSNILKTDKGFRVDDLSVSRLSGSAKSILGIALRSALRDIFAPNCGFIFFDEPYSDMDLERTAAASGAVGAIRGQVITITHEEESGMAADQIIEIGG